MRNLRTQVLVIGGGAAGMAAALGAAEHGVEVLLVEREDRNGGVLNQCIHNGFGLHYFREELTGPEYAERFMKLIESRNIRTFTGAHVWKLAPFENTAFIVSESGIYDVFFDALVVTTGARERPFGALMIPGDRPAGIFTAGLAQRFVNIENHLPGKRALILGSGDIGLIMARRLTLEGMEVVGVVERLPYPGGLERNVQQCLVDFDIPLYLSHTVTGVEGKGRLEKVYISEVDDEFKPMKGTEKVFKVDTLILSVGLIPQTEILKNFVEIDPKTFGFITSNTGRTSLDSVFAAGNDVIIYDLVDYVSIEGYTAGKHAALHALRKATPSRRIPIIPGENIGVLFPRFYEEQEDLRIYVRVRKPLENVRVVVEPGIYSRKFDRVAPNEMITFTIPSEKIPPSLNRILVEVKKDEG